MSLDSCRRAARIARRAEQRAERRSSTTESRGRTLMVGLLPVGEQQPRKLAWLLAPGIARLQHRGLTEVRFGLLELAELPQRAPH